MSIKTAFPPAPRLARRNIAPEDRETWEWRRPDTSGWTDDERKRYQRFEAAIVDYLAGEKVTLIETKYRLRISQVQEQLARAMVKDDEGIRLGFCALVKFLHTKTQNRRKTLPTGAYPTGPQCKGGLVHVLSAEGLYPELEARVLGKIKGRKESKVSILALQKWLTATLTERGYKKEQYPFNTEIPFYSSLSRLVQKIKDQNAAEYIAAYGDKNQVANISVMSGGQHRRTRSRPFDEVEIDEHKLHGIGTVRIIVDGITKKIPAERAVGIAIVDRGTGGILGGAVCLSPEAKADALIEAIRSAVIPNYVVALPSGKPAPPFRTCDFDPRLAGCVWSAAYIDNAKIHISDQYLEATKRLGAQTCYGPLGSWSGRPRIEGTFSRIVKGKFDRLPSTTGLDKGGGSRRPPAEQAIAYDIDHDDLCLAFYGTLGEINTDVAHGLLYQTPLHVIDDYLKSVDHPILRRLPPAMALTPEIGEQVVYRPVRQRSADNPNLYVSYMGCKYTNEALSRRLDLLGERIAVHIAQNLRYLKAFELNGRPLGQLKADGIWGMTDHTHEIRRAVFRDKSLKFGQHGQSPELISTMLAKKARKILTKNEKRPRGGVVKGAIELQRMMQATGIAEVVLKSPPVPDAALATTKSAAVRAREALLAREKQRGGK
ncbi:hypothetical protein [Herbaspirillum sp. ST 5-3]|uniref:hypothetical protein n=1 Tax=Oxalobacteraceae TaxID=75682 RepID=UPI0010A57DA1|nr:hypothetical protein [Herbaspirillum sp. ST 5-3]